VQGACIHPRASVGGAVPGGLGTEDGPPQGKGPALQGAGAVHRTNAVPENTVKIRLFPERKPVPLRPVSKTRNPAAIDLNKLSIPYPAFRGQQRKILLRKKHKTALVPAAGGTAGTRKPEPVRVKEMSLRLSIHATLFYSTSRQVFQVFPGEGGGALDAKPELQKKERLTGRGKGAIVNTCP
jgi:hypothetical protein